jgi:hypothetical protein
MGRWSIPVEKLAAKAKLDIATVVRAATWEVFSRVVLRSPVDTGRFRANWNISYGQPDITTSDNTDAAGSSKLAEVQKAILALPVGGTVYLCNSLPYAHVLEYGGYPNPPLYGSRKRGETEMTIHVVDGYSMQAPAGMIRISAQEFADAVRSAVE